MVIDFHLPCSRGPVARPPLILTKRPPSGRWLQPINDRAVLSTRRRDLLRDLDGQLQGRGRLRTRNTRLAARACTLDKGRELKFEWFAVFDLGSVTPNLFADAAIDLAALILIIEREVRIFLKNSNLTHPLGADAARGHVCHAAVFKMEPRVWDVFGLAEHGSAHGVDPPQRRA